MADVLGALKKVAPWIGAAVATALPGPLGAAAMALSKAVSTPDKPVTVEPTVDAITQTVMTALGNPEIVAKIREEDHTFQLSWQAAGFKEVTDLEALGNADRADARSRQVALKDRTPQIALYILLVLFALMFWVIVKFPINGENRTMAISMCNTIGVLTISACAFFFGTTQGSARKTELLAQAQPVNQDE